MHPRILRTHPLGRQGWRPLRFSCIWSVHSPFRVAKDGDPYGFPRIWSVHSPFRVDEGIDPYDYTNNANAPVGDGVPDIPLVFALTFAHEP